MEGRKAGGASDKKPGAPPHAQCLDPSLSNFLKNEKAVTVEFFFKFHFGFTLVQTIDLFYIWYAAYFFLQLKSL